MQAEREREEDKGGEGRGGERRQPSTSPFATPAGRNRRAVYTGTRGTGYIQPCNRDQQEKAQGHSRGHHGEGEGEQEEEKKEECQCESIHKGGGGQEREQERERDREEP